MKTLTEQVNVKTVPEGYRDIYDNDVIVFDPVKSPNVYETLCKYCADNDINMGQFEDFDIEATEALVESMLREAVRSRSKVKFWIDDQD